jgi:hypothetical protein
MNLVLNLGRAVMKHYRYYGAYGGETLSRAAVFQWWRHFKDSHTRVMDKAGSDRPSTGVMDGSTTKAAELLENDRTLTICQLSASMTIPFERTEP